MFDQQPNSQRTFKRLAKALISLRLCAGWSEPLLVAHTTYELAHDNLAIGEPFLHVTHSLQLIYGLIHFSLLFSNKMLAITAVTYKTLDRKANRESYGAIKSSPLIIN